MDIRVKLLAFFSFFAVLTKIISEFIHEVMGHGLFVVLFGGSITGVHIIPYWPYEFSSIHWSDSFASWQLSWIFGGGILVCLLVSIAIQGLLLFEFLKNWYSSSFLFWLSFWTFLNPTGYLVLGGIEPFDDVSRLIEEGVLTQEMSLIVGFSIFAVAFFSLSTIFLSLLLKSRGFKKEGKLRYWLAFFWLLLPFLTAVALIGRGWPVSYLPLSFVPAILALVFPIDKFKILKIKEIERE